MRLQLHLTLLFSLCFSAVFSLAQKTNKHVPTESAQALARRVLSNELKAEQADQSHWSFRLETKKPNGQNLETDRVVETKDGDLKLPIVIHGHALTAEQKQKADSRIHQLIQDPGPLRKGRADEDQDSARSQQFLKILPDAFHFSYGQRRGDLVELNFSPNPGFHPPTHEAEVFHAMQGNLWVDRKQSRLQAINGRLIHEVKFGGGILGHLNQGGTFQVKQANVAPGYWELTLLKVQMKGKALLFKTIGVQQNYTRSDFKKVSHDLTVAQAAQMLQGQTSNPLQQAKSARSRVRNPL